jgi:leucyl aminopeptidase (aminopeptidase T)
MKPLKLACVGLLAAAGFASVLTAQPIDTVAAAQRLVGAAAVREGDLVWIQGGAREIPLLEEVLIQTRALGAHPMLTLWSQRLAHDTYSRVPERFDSQAPLLNLKLAQMMDAIIYFDVEIAPDWFADIAPARREARSKAGRAFGDTLRERKVRIVNLGGGLFPNAQNAALYAMPQPELERMFWAAVAVDPGRLQAVGSAIKATLAKGRELRITHPNGTDLRMSIAGRPSTAFDGRVAEGAAAGPGAFNTWLPAGEVLLTPVPGTAEGVLVAAPDVWEGKEVLDWTLRFSGGRLVSMTGRGGGFAALKARYDGAAEGKEALAGIDVGLNPEVKLPAATRVQNTMPAGMVSIWTGDNTWAGGENRATFSLQAYAPGATLTVDGAPIVEGGRLKH